jgi:hypothetical protein
MSQKHHFKSLVGFVGSPISPRENVVVLDPIGIGISKFPFFNMGSIFIKQIFERGNPEQHDFNPIAKITRTQIS